MQTRQQVITMAQLVVENLDSLLIKKLKSRSLRHGRSLNEELITILEQAVDAEVIDIEIAMVEAREKLEQARARYPDRIFSDSTQLVREDRER